MKTLSKKQLEYRGNRQQALAEIVKFVLHFGSISVEVQNDEPFTIIGGAITGRARNTTIGIDVYDLRIGDNVDIAGSQGTITKIDEVKFKDS